MDDEFLPSVEYLEKWGYEVDEQGSVSYTNKKYRKYMP